MSVHKPIPHDSAHKHVAGSADYIDDIIEPAGTLHAYFGLSTRAHAKILSLNLDAVRSAPGVVGVLLGSDMPGVNDVSPVGAHDDPVIVEDVVSFYGQAIFAVVAETREQARRAATLADVEYEDLDFILDTRAAKAAGGKLVTKPLTLSRGDADMALAASKHRIKGQIEIGGQDHFYLEGHIALAVPGEDDDIALFASTQHPSEMQHLVAHVLDTDSASVTVQVRRMGGGFGGKETQGAQFAALAAVAAKKYNRPVKIRPDRDADMIMTGKRHDFVVDYDIGFDDDGNIDGVVANFAARSGHSADLSGPVSDRALFHADNAYYYPDVRLTSEPLKTNTVSNTAFRGFGGPQGLMAGERMIEEIAFYLGKDPLEIRRANFYGTTDRNVTPYHQVVEDNIMPRVVDELEASSDYQARRAAILQFNRDNKFIKKGIALTPVKFGISFTATWYNQAGALVHVYRDGSVQINHGGTEMGQGLNLKVAQIVADEFGIALADIKITATDTSKVPNTSATAASAGTDLNGKAAEDACRQIKERLAAFVAEKFGGYPEQVRFENGQVGSGAERLNWADVIEQAYMARTHLSAAGFYKTPEIHWDRETGRGQPFYYFAYGASVSEVSIDVLTGEYHVDRADVLHDVGKSLNPAVDLGQVEGGFIQGMGWLTTEELWWDDKGQLRTHAPSTYKIPVASDVPPIFNVKLADWSENTKRSIRRSKAVGEPPLMLAVSVVEALSMAVASVADYKICPRLNTPVTPERVLMAVTALQRDALQRETSK